MKICIYCHNRIPKEALICPMCGSDVSGSEAIPQDAFYQSTLFEESTEHILDVTADNEAYSEATSRPENHAEKVTTFTVTSPSSFQHCFRPD